MSPSGPAVAAERVVQRRLESARIPRARFSPGSGWNDGVMAEQLGAVVRVHWFGRPVYRHGVLVRCERVLSVLGYDVEWTTNAAGDEALDVKGDQP